MPAYRVQFLNAVGEVTGWRTLQAESDEHAVERARLACLEDLGCVVFEVRQDGAFIHKEGRDGSLPSA